MISSRRGRCSGRALRPACSVLSGACAGKRSQLPFLLPPPGLRVRAPVGRMGCAPSCVMPALRLSSRPIASNKRRGSAVFRIEYAGVGVSELRRLQQLEDENRRLRGLVADLTLDQHILQGPTCLRADALEAIQLLLSKPQKGTVALKMCLRDLAMVRVRFGYSRLTVLLKREGWPVGKKLVYRIYRELGAMRRERKQQ
jgi:hypothetical protein